MKSLITYPVILLLVLLAMGSSAQKKTFIRSADEAFEDQRYAIAIEKYQKAYTKVKKNPAERDRISFRLAECFRLTGDVARAQIQYKRLIKNGYDNKEPLLLLYYADALKMEGSLNEATEYYNLYMKKKPEDPRGQFGLQACELIPGWSENTTKYQINDEKKLNSRESDFAPAFSSENYNSLIFTSTREAAKGKSTDEWTDQDFSSLFQARMDRNNEWSTPTLVDDLEDGGVNTEANEGAPSLNADFTVLYFTRCPNEDMKKNGCQIYFAKRSGRFWSTPEFLELSADTTEAIGHPCLTEDELTIYFSSDRPGGQGGKDLWAASREGRSDPFGRPVNLGPKINTPGDEVFPHLRADTSLYFASSAHPGLGGLDIFASQLDSAGKWDTPVNIGTPINSTADDFAIIFHPTEERGFFSTNRSGRKSGDDIYSFIIPPVEFTLTGTVKDNRTLQWVPLARVEIIGSDGVSMTARTNDKGVYMFGKSQIMGNTTYEIIVSKDNYFNTSGRITTVGEDKSKDFTRDFILEPIPEEPIILPEILYDLAKWDLKPQYQDSLQGLITTLDENPTLIIELASHTDARDTEERNDILSQRRAQSVVDYLIERGIDPDRLVAKGYGERVPRRLEKDIVRDGFLFKAGTVLTEAYIDTLKTTPHKEAAHQLNRRTEFKVVSKDFVPKPKNVEFTRTVEIRINPEDNVVDYTLTPKTGLITASCIVNGYKVQFVYDPKLIAQINQSEALKLLANGAIGKQDFLGDPEKILAGGSIANRAVFLVRDFSIANQTIHDIEVMVNTNQEYPLVIGSAVMNKFGAYQIDNEKKRIVIKKQ